MRWLRNAAGLLLLGLIVVGVPWAVFALVGDPLARLAGLRLDAPLSEPEIIGLIAAVVLALWAGQMVCLLAEVVREIRGREVILPSALAGPQAVARLVIGLLLAGTAVAGSTHAPSPAGAAEMVEPAAHAGPANSTVTSLETTSAELEEREASIITVRRDDSLWQLASDHLGEGARWTEIRDLNAGRTMSDGLTFSNELQPGWRLRLPDDASELSSRVVEAGDTLSQIAAEELGDADQFEEIFEASRGIEQPGGKHLENADVIEPGWTVRIPHGQERVAAPASRSRPAEQSRPDRSITPDGADAEDSVPRAETAPKVASEAGSDYSEEGSSDEASVIASWVLPGLLTGGALLAGGMIAVVRRRRRLQARNRLPGQVPKRLSNPAVLAEKTLNLGSDASMRDVELVDRAIRRLAAAVIEEDRSLPDLAAIELTETDIALHLRSPARPPASRAWQATSDDEIWFAPRASDPLALGPGEVDTAPWPLIATLGHDRRNSVWLLNLGGLEVSVTGDRQARHDFMRHLAMQMICNPWSLETVLDLVGVADEVEVADPERVLLHSDPASPSAAMSGETTSVVERLGSHGLHDEATARALGDDPDVWPVRALILSEEHGSSVSRESIRSLLTGDAHRTGAAVVAEAGYDFGAFDVHVDSERHLTVKAVDLELTACGLASSEARAASALLAELRDVESGPPPDMAGNDRWHELATSTGSVRDEFASDRHQDDARSVLDEDNAAYAAGGTAVIEDLAPIAPGVTKEVRDKIAAADPSLDDDLRDWSDAESRRPRLRLLGPVEAWASGRPPAEKKAMHLEMFAYLATRPAGATSDEAADALARSKTDIAKLVSGVRAWCGTDADGRKFVPEAMKSEAARARGVGVYEMKGVLTDLDLFRRLRLRANAKGAEGVDDLWQALRLVSGRPFSHLRPRGWGWVLEGDREDLAAESAIVDVAHVLVLFELGENQPRQAHEAVNIALSSSPASDVAHLDLAAVLRADHAIADALVIEGDLADSGGALPDDLPGRSDRLLRFRCSRSSTRTD